MSETEHEPRLCDAALSRAFQFLGKRWNGVLLGTLIAGPLGFTQLKRAVAGISDSVLAERLTELSTAGLVQRTVLEGPPVTVTYALTANGQALAPALEALTTWAAENLTQERCSTLGHTAAAGTSNASQATGATRAAKGRTAKVSAS